MKIAILGFAKQGQAAYAYWNEADNEITVCDQDPEIKLPFGVKSHLGQDYLKNLGEFDLLVRTPLLHPSAIINANSPQIVNKITSVTNEFLKVCPTKNVIGVTGTKGKGTTSTLIAKMLEMAGYRVHLGGNIGTPPLDLLKNNIKPADYVVLELANFQLIDLKYSPHIAVCLMVVPEHMDWHNDLQEYISSKQQLFRHQTSDDLSIYFSGNKTSEQIASVSPGQKIPYFSSPGAYVEGSAIKIDSHEIIQTNQLKLLGKHNWQNVCAAVTAAWQITQDISAIRKVLMSFTGLKHRLEFVRELSGVKYYDDSFGTTPETAIVAIEAFSQPKVLILGGSDKGSDFSQLAQAVIDNDVRHVVAIGDTAEAIVDKIDGRKNIRKVEYTLLKSNKTSMQEIVNAARQKARPGDVVLLSTGCASFGMFKNYQDRGEQFKQTVLELA